MTDPFVSDGMELRRATPLDDDLIRRILALAAGWQQERVAYGEPLAPELGVYHEGWMRVDDLGVFAFSGIEFLGGAYARRVGPADGSYGFVDPALWEVTIGVEPEHRRRGIGRLVLESLKAMSLESGVAGLSLSVDLDNPARRLYVESGFVTVEERSTDALMVWRLASP